MTASAPLRRLVLMRHAKSSWAVAGAPDHDRPLNLRGRLAAALMGAWVAEQSWRIDLALISSSARTRETWARMRLTAGAVAYRAELYHAAPEALWDAAKSAPQSVETTLVLAHNPGIEALLSAFPGGPRRAPTSAIAIIESQGAWAEIGPETARIAAYEEPKSLV